MLPNLRFVQGAVSKKDFLPALTHFRIEGGTVRSFNGTLALCSPIDFDIDCTPKAEPLVKAIQNCEDTVSLSMTPTGKLSVKSGSFKALIECVDHETPHVVPEGDHIDIDGEALLAAIKTLSPVVGNDASRPWSTGILLKDRSAFATNNIILAEYWIGSRFPVCCNIPRSAIKEMIRVGKAPIGAQVAERSITFHYENERWIRAQLLATEWPDLDPILNVPSNQQPIDDRIFTGLEKLKPFVDKMGRIYFKDCVMSTHEQLNEGAVFELPGNNMEGVYQIDMLAVIKQIATSIDFNSYPRPCQFNGNKLRGAIVGIKL